MYLSLDPSLRTASTLIDDVPVLEINNPITICLLEIAETIVVECYLQE